MSNINKNQDSFKDIKKAIRKALNPLRKYVKENLVSIKAPNGVVIIIDKGSINNFIMSDDEISKIVKMIKKEMINENSNDVSANEGVGENQVSEDEGAPPPLHPPDASGGLEGPRLQDDFPQTDSVLITDRVKYSY